MSKIFQGKNKAKVWFGNLELSQKNKERLFKISIAALFAGIGAVLGAR